MIVKRIKAILNDFRGRLDENKSLLKEIEWANIYHDSIRDNKELQKLSLKIGRWAGNYSFFFLVHRILKDFQPQKIVEFGLGESSKFISTFNSSTKDKHEHIVIEQDESWTRIFNESFLNENVNIQYHPLKKKKFKEFEYNGYENVENIPTDADFYLVDGPFGSSNFSRLDILHVLEKIVHDKQFILVLDDYNRKGEQETANEILKMFERKGKKVYTGKFEGGKAQFVLVTEKYKYVLSL
jgi:hypothetical protein